LFSFKYDKINYYIFYFIELYRLFFNDFLLTYRTSSVPFGSDESAQPRKTMSRARESGRREFDPGHIAHNGDKPNHYYEAHG